MLFIVALVFSFAGCRPNLNRKDDASIIKLIKKAYVKRMKSEGDNISMRDINCNHYYGKFYTSYVVDISVNGRGYTNEHKLEKVGEVEFLISDLEKVIIFYEYDVFTIIEVYENEIYDIDKLTELKQVLYKW